MNKHQRQSQETVNRLLDAASSCFARTGYDGTSVTAICQSAGISKGAFYHHFESKQALFLALLNRWLTDLDQKMLALSQEQVDFPESLLSMADIVEQILEVPEQELLIYLEFINKAVREPQLWQQAIEPYFRYRDLLAGLIEEGLDQDSLNSINPKTAANMVIGLALGMLIQGFLDPEGEDWPRSTRVALGSLIIGMKG